MARMNFVSGRVKFGVSFNDRTNQYKVKMCVRESRSRPYCTTQYVGLPGQGYNTSAHGRPLGVDDPRSMAQAAQAAVAFAADDGHRTIGENVNYDRRGTHVIVRPARRAKRRR